MSDQDHPQDGSDRTYAQSGDLAPDDPLAEPIAYRDTSERLPNEALRSELETMSEDEQEAYLRHLEELARLYLGPGGP